LILLGNLISMVGCVLMVLIGFVRRKERILQLQCVPFAFLAGGNLLLGAFSGFISGMVSIGRNLVFPRAKRTFLLKLLFIGAQILLTVVAGWAGPVSLLPLISGVLFTWFLDTKSEIQLKIVIILAQLMWACYDLCYVNYVAFTFDILTVLSNVIGIVMIQKEH